MASRKIAIITTVLVLLFSTGLSAQRSQVLSRSLPETEGVSSEGIAQFLDAVVNSKNELHSIMVMRHGKVIAEAWQHPYRADLKHTMYSCSKSFTATAIGFAVSEKRLTVNDKVISFFPDELPSVISPHLAALSVKDLLTMSAGQEPEPTGLIVTSDSNWVKSFFALPIVHQPGTRFLYNSACTYMLSAIVQKTTGEKLIDYLRPRLFEPLGITGMDWEIDPRGINVGGWGLRIKTEDMAKFGQLFLQKGIWNGKQVLPQGWAEEASTLRIIQHPELEQEKKDQSDWEQGYCYQMWRSRHHSYRGDGAFGQYILVLPDQDAVIAITSETPDMQDELNLVWKYLLPAFQAGPLPANPKNLALLQQKIASLALPTHQKGAAPASVKNLSGKTFAMATNEKGIQQLSFKFKKNSCQVTFNTNTDSYKISFGKGKWAQGETNKRGPYLVAAAKASYVGLPPAKIAGSYRWQDDKTLELTLRYIESPHTETFICRLDGGKLAVDYYHSFNKANIIAINGVEMAFNDTQNK